MMSLNKPTKGNSSEKRPLAQQHPSEKKLAELRKIERQAKQLIYKMKRLEARWNGLRNELKESGKNLPRTLPQTLGDVLANWNRLS